MVSRAIDSDQPEAAFALKGTLFLLVSIQFADLSSVTDQVIHQDQRHHRLSDWRCPYANAGVVPPFGDNVDRLSSPIDAPPRLSDA